MGKSGVHRSRPDFRGSSFAARPWNPRGADVRHSGTARGFAQGHGGGIDGAVTIRPDAAAMASQDESLATHPDDKKPLASYVLRVRGRPATLRFEMVNLRDGTRHVFRQSRSVVAFLQKHGLTLDDAAATGDGDG